MKIGWIIKRLADYRWYCTGPIFHLRRSKASKSVPWVYIRLTMAVTLVLLSKLAHSKRQQQIQSSSELKTFVLLGKFEQITGWMSSTTYVSSPMHFVFQHFHSFGYKYFVHDDCHRTFSIFLTFLLLIFLLFFRKFRNSQLEQQQSLFVHVYCTFVCDYSICRKLNVTRHELKLKRRATEREREFIIVSKS